MSRDPLHAIAVVRDFLDQRLLTAIPADLTGETRAAIKLLDESIREITERDDAYEPIDTALATLLPNTDPRPDHHTLLAAADQRLAQLHNRRTTTNRHTDIDAEITHIYQLLGNEAHTRTHWQSVFPNAPSAKRQASRQ